MPSSPLDPGAAAPSNGDHPQQPWQGRRRAASNGGAPALPGGRPRRPAPSLPRRPARAHPRRRRDGDVEEADSFLAADLWRSSPSGHRPSSARRGRQWARPRRHARRRRADAGGQQRRSRTARAAPGRCRRPGTAHQDGASSGFLGRRRLWPPAPPGRRASGCQTTRTMHHHALAAVQQQEQPFRSRSRRHEYVNLIDGFFSIPFPFASLLPFTTYGQALKARKKVAGALREVIRKRMDGKVENGGANGEEDEKRDKDLVEELLQAEGGSFSEEEMVDFCLSLLVAGYETTTVLMTLAVKLLSETSTALAQLKGPRATIATELAILLRVDATMVVWLQ